MRHIILGVLAALGSIALPVQAQPAPSLETPAQFETRLSLLAKAIADVCPESDAAQGIAARDACSEKLGKLDALASVTSDSLLWGATQNAGFDPSKDKLTRLDAFVWRRLYLSLFAFPGSYKIETLANGDRLLRLDAAIRPIPPEEFPYPFWHSVDKWRDYLQSNQIGFLFRNNELIAAYRNAHVDPARPVAAKTWDGKWTWEIDGKQGPHVALYTYVLSPGNPARGELETAYRDFEAASRPYFCTSCHNPANPAGINPLVFFTHPAQALVARHDIVNQLEINRMPPPHGIDDDAARQKLIALAKKFAAAGDRALSYERHQIAP
jgi:hypothetical protein